MDDQDATRTLAHIRQHIEQGLPLVSLFNIDLIPANAKRGVVRLRPGGPVTRPDDNIAGPVQFALADGATNVLILADHRDEAAVTIDLSIKSFARRCSCRCWRRRACCAWAEAC